MDLLIGFLTGIAANIICDIAKMAAGKAKAHRERNRRKGKHSR